MHLQRVCHNTLPWLISFSLDRMRVRKWISRVVIVVALIPLFFVQPMCDCPRYYIIVSFLGLVPLVSGPRLYRWFGTSYVLVALLFAYMNYSSANYTREQVERIRAEAANRHH
jgi:hypothetical protein